MPRKASYLHDPIFLTQYAELITDWLTGAHVRYIYAHHSMSNGANESLQTRTAALAVKKSKNVSTPIHIIPQYCSVPGGGGLVYHARVVCVARAHPCACRLDDVQAAFLIGQNKLQLLLIGQPSQMYKKHYSSR